MSQRHRLPNRRASETIWFECNSLRYVATVSRFPDGRLAEIFISNSKAGSHSDAAAKDAAVICSIALQYGVPLEVIRHALLRDAQGRPATPLGCALDLVGSVMTAEIITRFPPRRSAVIWLMPGEDGWLVLARQHGWLHGDRDAALRDARWLARNLDLPVREVAA